MRFGALLLLILVSSCTWVEGLRSVAPDAIGEVTAIEGVPRLLRGIRYQEIGPGTDLRLQDTIVTGAGEQVTISLNDGTEILLSEETEFSFHVYDKEAMPLLARMSFTRGDIRVTRDRSARKGKHSFEIVTRAAKIDGNGSFSAIYRENDAVVELTMLDGGSVNLHNSLGEVEISGRGNKGHVSFGAAPVAERRP